LNVRASGNLSGFDFSNKRDKIKSVSPARSVIVGPLGGTNGLASKEKLECMEELFKVK
jgi:hypothetical protein